MTHKKKSVRDLLHDLQCGTCHYCKLTTRLHLFSVDHRIPISRGGSNGYRNKVGCCLRCNQAKGLLTECEFRDAPKDQRKALQRLLQKEHELKHGIVNPNATHPRQADRV